MTLKVTQGHRKLYYSTGTYNFILVVRSKCRVACSLKCWISLKCKNTSQKFKTKQKLSHYHKNTENDVISAFDAVVYWRSQFDQVYSRINAYCCTFTHIVTSSNHIKFILPWREDRDHFHSL